MDIPNVTFAYDDEHQENILKHTKLFINRNLKKQIEVLVKENIELKKKIEHKDKPFMENLDIESKASNLCQTKYSWEKCCLKFPSMEKVKKHKSEMHKITLTF